MMTFLTRLLNTRVGRFIRRHLSSLIKISVTVAGLAFVLWKIPAAQIRDELVIVSIPWLIVTFLLMTSSLFLRAYRWMLLLRGLNAKVAYGRLVELYFVGNFFNAFLPSGFGGDAVRIIEVARDVPANIAAGTVVVDRLTGLLALFAMALAGLPFRPENFPDNLTLVITCVAVAGLIVGFILFEGSMIRRFGGWLPGKLSPQGDGPVAKFLDAVQGCGIRAIMAAIGVSFIFNLVLIAWWASAARALGFQIPLMYFVLVVPILSVALLVPSISGLGVREVLAGTLFSGAGLTNAEAVALSLLVWLVTRAVSLLGAPIYIISTIRENRKDKIQSVDDPAKAPDLHARIGNPD